MDLSNLTRVMIIAKLTLLTALDLSICNNDEYDTPDPFPDTGEMLAALSQLSTHLMSKLSPSSVLDASTNSVSARATHEVPDSSSNNAQNHIQYFE